jgi:hypothetical protein
VSLPATFADAEGAVKAWVNSLTTDLVGAGKPLAKGAHLSADPLHGARNVCYALLNQVGGGAAFGAENPDQRARISARIYGPSKEAAALAAAGYANALVALATGAAVAVSGAQILTVDPDTISGPLWTPDFGEPRYLIDADFYLRPA